MRIVIDTNVIASGIFFGGKPRELLKLVYGQKIEAYISHEILNEYCETLEELKKRYPTKSVNLPLTEITSRCHWIETSSSVNICRDPDDDKFIECAIDARCIYVVSGDKDLLSLGRYKNVEIVTVNDFFEKHWNK